MPEMAVCSNHPEIETKLSCGRCGTIICYKCVMHAPVGIRCFGCVRTTKIPVFDVDSLSYVKVTLASIVLSILASLFFGFVFVVIYRIQIILLAAMIGVGYALGESVSFLSNRKISNLLKLIAATNVVIFFVCAGLLNPLVFIVTFGNPFLWVTFLMAVYVATLRIR